MTHRLIRFQLFKASLLIFVLYLPTLQPAAGQNFIEQTIKLVPEKASTEVGQSVANLGGFFDPEGQSTYIAIGEPDAPGGGAIWIGVLDEQGMLSSKNPPIRIPEAPGELEGLDEGDQFGYAVAPIADLDGNGIPELAVGAIGDDDPYAGAGAVWILYLGEKGEIKLAVKITGDQIDAPEPVSGDTGLGHAVAGVTGISEENQGVLVTSTRDGRVFGCFIDKGGVFGCSSTDSGDDTSEEIAFGAAIQQVGPPGINGFTPLAIGAPEYSEAGETAFQTKTGRIYFHSIRGVGDQIIFTPRGAFTSDRNSSMGAALASPGDLDGDGCMDLVAGGPQYLTGGFAPGYFYLIYLNCSVVAPAPLVFFAQQLDPQDSPNTVLRGGTSLAVYRPAAGAAVHLLAGAPNDTEAGEDRGAIHHIALYDPLPPLAFDDEVTVTEDTPRLLSTIFNNDRLNDQTPFIASRSNSFGNSGMLDPQSIGLDESFTYTPAADFFGETSLTYRLGDNRFVSIFDSPYTFARINVTVTPVEDAPRIITPDSLLAAVGNLYNQVAIASEVDGDSMTVTVLKKPDWLAVAISGYAAETSIQFIGTPQAADAGTHEVILSADDGKGTTTTSFLITVPAEVLNTPQLLAPADGAVEQPLDVLTAWNAVTDATAYVIQLSTDETFTSIVSQTTVNTTGFEFTGLDPETTYFWRVQARNGDAMSEFSSAFSFTTETVASGVANEADAGLLVDELASNYPNPFSHSTTIPYQLSSPGPVQLAVFDLLGREVLKVVDQMQPAGRHEAKADLEHLPAGIYLYELRAGDFIAVRRMVLLH